MNKIATIIQFVLILSLHDAVCHSPLAVAASADENSLVSLSQKENTSDFNTLNANATLQKLIRDKYGVSISEVLDMWHKRDKDDPDSDWLEEEDPRWRTKLLAKLTNEVTPNSGKKLIMTPQTFVDDGRWYLEFTCEVFLKKGDTLICYDINLPHGKYLLYYLESKDSTVNSTITLLWPLFPAINGTHVYCEAENHVNGVEVYTVTEHIPIEFNTVVESVTNDFGPWVWPSASVVKYNSNSPVKLTCWVWLLSRGTVLWYHVRGTNKTEIVAEQQTNEYSYIKLELSKIFMYSDNASEIVCVKKNKKTELGSQRITLIYDSPLISRAALDDKKEKNKKKPNNKKKQKNKKKGKDGKTLIDSDEEGVLLELDPDDEDNDNNTRPIDERVRDGDSFEENEKCATESEKKNWYSAVPGWAWMLLAVIVMAGCALSATAAVCCCQ